MDKHKKLHHFPTDGTGSDETQENMRDSQQMGQLMRKHKKLRLVSNKWDG